MTTETKTPDYLQNEYVIEQGEHLTILDSLLAWYWTSWAFLKENLIASKVNPDNFLEQVKKCKTTKEVKTLVNQYI